MNTMNQRMPLNHQPVPGPGNNQHQQMNNVNPGTMMNSPNRPMHVLNANNTRLQHVPQQQQQQQQPQPQQMVGVGQRMQMQQQPQPRPNVPPNQQMIRLGQPQQQQPNMMNQQNMQMNNNLQNNNAGMLQQPNNLQQQNNNNATMGNTVYGTPITRGGRGARGAARGM